MGTQQEETAACTMLQKKKIRANSLLKVGVGGEGEGESTR